jgi:hypothetical protein
LIRITRYFLDRTPLRPVVEDHFYLTSLSPSHKDGCAKAILAIARGHWEIENKLHWVKDVTMREDACRNKKAALGLAWLRNLAVYLLGFVAGDSVPQKVLRVQADPAIARKLIAMKRRPRKLLGEF